MMTWGEFRELFMSKFFPASARHEKAPEFLELKQGSMTVFEYVAKFTELAHFGDDFVANDMSKVRKFEDGLKLSIRGKLYGQNDYGHREREIKDARSIQDMSASGKKKED